MTAVAVALWLTAGVWGPGAPEGDDMAARLVRTAFAMEHLVGEGKPDGWQPRFGLGYQAFLFIGPGFTWTVAALQGLSLGSLSVSGAFKTVVVGSYVVLPLAVAFLARSFGLSRLASALGAVLALAVSGPLAGVGLHGLFDVGLVTNQLGALWWCLALGAVVRQLDDERPRWVLLAGVAGAALALTHIVSVLVLGLVVAVFVLGTSWERRLAWRRVGASLAASALLASGLAAVMLVPILAHRDLQGTFTGLVEPPLGERLAAIWRGDIVLAGGVAPVALGAMVLGLSAALVERRRRGVALLLLPFGYLALAYTALALWPDSLVTRQLPTRALGYLALLALLPLATLLSWAGGCTPSSPFGSEPTSGRDHDRPWGQIGGISGARPARSGQARQVGVVVATVALVVASLAGIERPGEAEPEPALRAAADRLAELVPEGARFATQRDFPAEIDATGVSHPDFWLAWLSGRNTLNIFNAESSAVNEPVFEPERIGERTPRESADALSRLGVTHVVLVDEDEGQELVVSPRFEPVWRSAPLAILAVNVPPGQPPPASLLATDAPSSARLVRAEPEHLEIELDAEDPTTATVAVGWSPKWHARLDGRPVPLERSDDALLSLALPAGEHYLALDYRSDGWDRLGLVVSVITAVGLVGWLSRGWLSRDRWRRSRQPETSGPESS